MEKVEVSVVIPVYNQEDWLSETLGSLLKQTYCDFEVIIVNDGSLDRSGQIMDEYCRKDKRFKRFDIVNSGVVAARHYGRLQASGNYLLYLDGDDFLEPEAIGQLLSVALARDADMVFMDYRTVDVQGNKMEEVINRIVGDPSNLTVLNDMYLGNVQWAVWGYLHKATLYKNMEYPDCRLVIGEDCLLTSMLLQNAEVILKCDKALLNYRVRSDSATKTKELSDRGYESYRLFPELTEQLFEDTPMAPALEMGIAFLKVRAAVEPLHYHRYDDAVRRCRMAARALKRFPGLKSRISVHELKLIKDFALFNWLGKRRMERYIRKGCV